MFLFFFFQFTDSLELHLLMLSFFFFLTLQALKNIAAISLAISYPNKSTKLLNMAPWEISRKKNVGERSCGATRPDSAGWFHQKVVGGNRSSPSSAGPLSLPSVEYLPVLFKNRVDISRGQEHLPHFFTILFALEEFSISACAFTDSRTVCLGFCFFLLSSTWCLAKGHEVCQISILQGEVCSVISLPFLKILFLWVQQLLWITKLIVVKMGHLGNLHVSADM